jgi:hypothetical protein
MGDNYLSIANSWGMWLASAAIIVVVFFQAIRISTIAFRAGKEIGMTKKQLLSAFRTGITTAIVPSIAVLLGLAVMIPKLGLPFPWMRLSVIGSVSYELMAAGIGAGAVVKDGLAGNMNGIAFSCAVWAMSIGCIFNLIMVAFFTPHIMKLKDKIAGGDEGWLKVMTAAAFFGAVGYMVAQPIVKGHAPLVALIGGFVSMVLVGAVITVGKQNWLKEWALALAIIGGMAAAGLAYLWFGIGA